MTKKEKRIRAEIAKAHQDSKALAKLAVTWLKGKAIERANRGEHYKRAGFNTGEVVRGLDLGRGWDSREKVYQLLMRGLKRAEELGYVEICRNSSPIKFRYAGPEIDEAEEQYKRNIKRAKEDMERLARKIRLKGISVSSESYGEDRVKVTMTAQAFTRLAERAGHEL